MYYSTANFPTTNDDLLSFWKNKKPMNAQRISDTVACRSFCCMDPRHQSLLFLYLTISLVKMFFFCLVSRTKINNFSFEQMLELAHMPEHFITYSKRRIKKLLLLQGQIDESSQNMFADPFMILSRRTDSILLPFNATHSLNSVSPFSYFTCEFSIARKNKCSLKR